jgi:mono/diheme cytochrome c family protein
MRPLLHFVPVLVLVTVAPAANAGDGVDFLRDVAPIFERRCLQCHKTGKSEGGLSLSTPDTLRELEHVVAGNPDASPLIDAVTMHDGERPLMPKKGEPLSTREVEILRQWIKTGARWPDGVTLPYLWSLITISKPQPPVLRDEGDAQPESAIDAFVVRRLREDGFGFSPPATRRELIRRLKFDLLGLPPSSGEIHDFVQDDRPDAWPRLVERYLASPHYGERWAQHWLDVARFSESNGFEDDAPRPHAWPYRDYVVRSLNADKPYDQFVREQLAGDAVPNVTRDSMAATGFLVAGPWDHAAAVSASPVEKLRAREVQLEEMVATASQVFLGLTVNCARCHDHKFDPIPQADYYRMKAVFEGVYQADGRSRAARPLLTPDELREFQATKTDTKLAPQAFIGFRRQPAATVIFERGDIRQPGEAVEPAGLSAIRQIASDLHLSTKTPEGQRRLTFANWVTDSGNPLTARVIVNRVWQHHFGTGPVDTPSDFGANGSQPSHPRLLDWLAAQFMEEGWSLKSLHRRILASRTWQQSSAFNPSAARVDADNRLLWRFAPQRLDAETVRDAMLVISGELNPRLGGPSFQAFTTTRNNTYYYHLTDTGEPQFNRRTIYRMKINTGRDPLLDALDCPAPSVMSPSRRRSVTPLQALALMNDSFVLRQADRLAERIEHSVVEPDSQIVEAWQRTLGRPPNHSERQLSKDLIDNASLQELCWALFNSAEFLEVR